MRNMTGIDRFLGLFLSAVPVVQLKINFTKIQQQRG